LVASANVRIIQPILQYSRRPITFYLDSINWLWPSQRSCQENDRKSPVLLMTKLEERKNAAWPWESFVECWRCWEREGSKQVIRRSKWHRCKATQANSRGYCWEKVFTGMRHTHVLFSADV
jgi:hypothetical protein